MSVDSMTCRELVEIITDYLEGRLAPVDRERFETHLIQCPGCRDYLDQMRQTISLVGILSEDNLPPAARDRLLEAFQRWSQI